VTQMEHIEEAEAEAESMALLQQRGAAGTAEQLDTMGVDESAVESCDTIDAVAQLRVAESDFRQLQTELAQMEEAELAAAQAEESARTGDPSDPGRVESRWDQQIRTVLLLGGPGSGKGTYHLCSF
jgi:hypothetical protein